MPEPSRAPAARILVTCDTSPLGTAALGAATALARRLDAELAGLFVENIDLLRMAALPFAREYALASAIARRIEAGELESALRRQADAVRDAVSHAARELSVPWSFQVVRGTLLDSVLEAMREPDLAVFGHGGRYSASLIPRAAMPVLQTDVIAPRQPILVLYDGSPVSGRALDAASVLAQTHRASLIVLLMSGDAGRLPALRDRASGRLAGSPVAVRYQNLASRDIQSIRKIAGSNHAAALLWHGVQTQDERKTLAALVDALKCPVVLVS